MAMSACLPETELSHRLAGLLTEVGRGDSDAFTTLYRLTHHRVLGFAGWVLHDRSAAEDVAQEVFLQVWSQAGRYDASMASPMGWIKMLTHRRAVDRVRSESSATRRDVLYGETHIHRDHDTVLEVVEQHFEEREVARCLDTLTERQRESIVLAYYGGQSYDEIAVRLGTRPSTVKTRIRDGLRRLSARLDDTVDR
ncbi:sigma-70 family RNA polymerase sigma factor [Nocardia sp. NPDC059240]|uniref:sigma-70 family RNA polymerase sigma factor n=1 Tax=Nocardia sp. NPDC059240 TaxID=3346786 RepID=UPI0036C934E6